jgi:DNA-binding transcriptional ArsR family regulator
MCPTASKPKTQVASLDRVMKSLGDPVRLSIVRQLLAAAEGEIACGGFEYEVTKQTFSHHLAILEEVGLVQGRPDGTRRLISLRLDHIERAYPGLLDLIRAAA